MKNLINFISVVALFAITMTSCGQEEIETIVSEPTLEEQLLGEWQLTAFNVSVASVEPITGDTISLSIVDSGSLLELTILEDNEVTLTGTMSTAMSIDLFGEEMIIEEDETYDDPGTWEINANEGFEFETEGGENFGVATLVDDKLVFVLTELPDMTDEDDDFPMDIEFSELSSEIIFSRK